MKQHITLSQYEELEDSSKIKLAQWYFDDKTRTSEWALIYPAINIGKMIEFLHECDKFFCIETLSDNTFNINDNYIKKYKELCDGLWEVVKEVLNGNES